MMPRGKTMEDERVRLERIYSEMSDLELAELAQEAASLTDVARNILESELVERGMEPLGSEKRAEITSEQPEEEEEARVSGPLVMVRRFRDLPDAVVAKSILDSAEIDSFLADENMVRIDWFISNLLGGVKLMVRPEDAAEAIALLDESANEENAAKGMGAEDETDGAGEANE